MSTQNDILDTNNSSLRLKSAVDRLTASMNANQRAILEQSTVDLNARIDKLTSGLNPLEAAVIVNMGAEIMHMVTLASVLVKPQAIASLFTELADQVLLAEQLTEQIKFAADTAVQGKAA